MSPVTRLDPVAEIAFVRCSRAARLLQPFFSYCVYSAEEVMSLRSVEWAFIPSEDQSVVDKRANYSTG
jgi:hypothetical protein